MNVISACIKGYFPMKYDLPTIGVTCPFVDDQHAREIAKIFNAA